MGAPPLETSAREDDLSRGRVYNVTTATQRSITGDRALATAGPRAWNSLPVDLRLSRTFLLSKHT